MGERKMKEIGMLFNGEMVRAILAGRKTQTRRIIKGIIFNPLRMLNPPCNVGDLIYVRETWADAGEQCNEPDLGIVYKATDPEWQTEQTGFKWKPSIHMPKWAARIWLEVTAVRFELLQDISEADAAAEGVPEFIYGCVSFTAREAFQEVWTECYGAESWKQNPFVWVIEFRRVEK
jgi:hypothetical protein